MVLVGIIALGSFGGIGWFAVIRLWMQVDTLTERNNQLQTRVSDAQWREQRADSKIEHLEKLLHAQVQHALAPEAEELAAWIKETETELKHDG